VFDACMKDKGYQRSAAEGAAAAAASAPAAQ
jgi:outer membrane protein H.8